MNLGGRRLIDKFCFSFAPFDSGNVLCSNSHILSPPLASHSCKVSAFCDAWFFHAGRKAGLHYLYRPEHFRTSWKSGAIKAFHTFEFELGQAPHSLELLNKPRFRVMTHRPSWRLKASLPVIRSFVSRFAGGRFFPPPRSVDAVRDGAKMRSAELPDAAFKAQRVSSSNCNDR